MSEILKKRLNESRVGLVEAMPSGSNVSSSQLLTLLFATAHQDKQSPALIKLRSQLSTFTSHPLTPHRSSAHPLILANSHPVRVYGYFCGE